MREVDLRTELLAVRRELRRIDGEIAAIREESKRFRTIGFGRDIKDIQLMALREEREFCIRRIAEIEGKIGRGILRGRKVEDLLIIPVALALLGVKALGFAGTSVSSRARRTARTKEYAAQTRVGTSRVFQ